MATLAGHPIPADYGRGATPMDAGLQVAIAQAAGSPIGQEAWRDHRSQAGWPPELRQVLLLEDRLPPSALPAVWAWLAIEGEPTGRSAGASLWTRRTEP